MGELVGTALYPIPLDFVAQRIKDPEVSLDGPAVSLHQIVI